MTSIRRTPPLVTLLALAAVTQASQAQEPAKLDTVVINARGRQEALQSVPVSVKAFTAQAIDDAGIRKPGDFVALTPNLQLTEVNSVGTSFMTIRGLAQVRNSEAPMAVVVDGVVQFDGRQFTQELFDVQSIEVLRGPQGALYGRNATGGAILIRTRQPGNETRGFMQASVGTGGETGVQGAIGGALVPNTLLFRLAGNFTDRKGYFDNEFRHETADPYRNKTLRGQLSWNVTSALSLDLRTSLVRDRAGGGNVQYQPTHLNPDCTADPNHLFDFSRIDANHVSYRFCYTNFGTNTRSMDELTLKADYALGFATLTGIVSHNKLTEYISFDQFPYTASRNLGGTDGTQSQFVDMRSKSYELRLISPTVRGLRWMAGVYGLRIDRFISTTTGSDLGQGIDFVGRDPRFDSPSNPTLSWFADDNRNRARAAFGNLDYDITPRIEASLALRHDRDERRQTVDHRQAAGTKPAGCTSARAAACDKHAVFSAMQPKLSLRYKAEDGSLSYVSVGKGFRSGQFNQSGVAAAAAAVTPPVLGVRDEIGAETTRSAELGYKTLLADGTVQLNAAVFTTQVRNAPYFVFIGQVGAQVLVPIDKLRLRGAELELVARPAPRWEAYAGFGLTDSRIEQYTANPAAVGNWAPYVARTSWNLGAQYRFPVAAGMALLLRADLVNKGRRYWTAENDVATDALQLLGLRAALEDAKGRWSATLAVSNATDVAYNAEFVGGGFVFPGNPRVTRLDLRYRF